MNLNLVHRFHFQKGKYEIPNWLSHESIEILAQMLQVSLAKYYWCGTACQVAQLQTDPHLRISTEELLQHPWVVKEHDIPVDSKSRIEVFFLHQPISLNICKMTLSPL